MQGIDIFDGKWDSVEVVNNVVVTNHWNGIAIFGVNNAKVINNTVLPSRPEKFMTWIMIRSSKDQRPSSNVVVRNNVAGQIIADGLNVDVDHNVALRSVGGPRNRNGEVVESSVTVSHNFNNVPLDSLFRNYDAAHKILDLRIAPRSLMLNAGADADAPAVDIEGRPRRQPVDIGAYAR